MNMRKFLLGAILAAWPFNAEAASNPNSVPHIGTIAAMQALGTASPQYATIIVDDKLAGGTFNYVVGSIAAVDNCTTFSATGVSIAVAHWQRENIDGKGIAAGWCGLVPSDGTDQSNHLVAAIEAANNLYGTGVVNYVTLPIGTIKTTKDIAFQVLSDLGPTAAIRVRGAVPAWISSNGLDSQNISNCKVIDTTSTNYNAALPSCITTRYSVIESNSAGTFGSPDVATATTATYTIGAATFAVANTAGIVPGVKISIHLDSGAYFKANVLSVAGLNVTVDGTIPSTATSGAAFGVGGYSFIIQSIQNVILHAQTVAAQVAIHWSPVHADITDVTEIGYALACDISRQGGDFQHTRVAWYICGWNTPPSGTASGAHPTYGSGAATIVGASMAPGFYYTYPNSDDERPELVSFSQVYCLVNNNYGTTKWGQSCIQGATLDTMKIDGSVFLAGSYIWNSNVHLIQNHVEDFTTSGKTVGDLLPRTFIFLNSNVQIDAGYLTAPNCLTANSCSVTPTYTWLDTTTNAHTLIDHSQQAASSYGIFGNGVPSIGVQLAGVSSANSSTVEYDVPSMFPNGRGYQGFLSVTLTEQSNVSCYVTAAVWVSHNYDGSSYHEKGYLIPSATDTNCLTGGNSAAFASIVPKGTVLAVSVTWGASIGVQAFNIDVAPGTGGPRTSN